MHPNWEGGWTLSERAALTGLPWELSSPDEPPRGPVHTETRETLQSCRTPA